MTIRDRLASTLALLLLVGASTAHAATLTQLAFDNATVQTTGPRTGANGKNFFNIEGSANGTFASYGVIDFSFGVLPFPVTAINSVTLKLTQSNAAFSTTGGVVFSLDHSATLANIQPSLSPLADDGATPGTTMDETQGDLALYTFGGGPFSYTVIGTGNTDSYTLVPDAATQAEMISRLNSVKTVRVVVGSGAPTVAATWAGFSNTSVAGPTLVLDVTYNQSTPTVVGTWGKIKAQYH